MNLFMRCHYLYFSARQSKVNQRCDGITMAFKRTCIRINNSLGTILSLSARLHRNGSCAQQILLKRSSEFVRTIMQIYRNSRPGTRLRVRRRTCLNLAKALHFTKEIVIMTDSISRKFDKSNACRLKSE